MSKAQGNVGHPFMGCLLSVAAAWTVALSAGTQQPQPTPPRPTFETKAELVLVDVNVIDREARPITTLTADDFELQVNGQPRKIDSLQFVSTVPTDTTPATTRESAFSSNETATTGRLLLFVVDENNLRAGSSRTILRTAQTMFDRLAPGDLIGLARLPNGNGNVEFTADRARVTTALARVTGNVGARAGMTKVNISEAFALENMDTSLWEQAIERECRGQTGADLEACTNAVEADARSMLIESSARSRVTLQALDGLLKGLAQLKTPINIVMISEGLFVARDRLNMSEIGKRAAEARATIHVIRPGQTYFDIEDSTAPGVSRFYDDGLLSEGLEQLAGQTRGSMSTVTGSAQNAFDRLGRELSGYYLLGFEPTDADRTGKERRIRVLVKTRGLTVRARPTFVIRESPGAADAAIAAAAGTGIDQVKDLLRAPLPTRGLPMRVASYTAVDAGSSKIRVVIAAEVGDPATTEVEWPVGVIVLDKNDRAIVSRAGPSKLEPASPRGPSPRLILTSLLLDPGEYTLRVASLDDTGRLGSVHHTINARLSPAGGKLNVSDLVLVSQPLTAGGAPRPRPSGVIDTEGMSAMIEMTGADQALLGRAKVTVQIADGENGSALVNVEARQALRGAGMRAFAARLNLGVLPPGEYVARAIITAPGQPETRVTRAFRLAPVMAADVPPVDLRVPLDPDAPPAPLAAVKIYAPVPRFVTDTVLVPGVVRPFLEGLEDLHPPSPAVEAILEQARNGNFAAPAEPGATLDDEVALTFVRGLGALERGEMPQATAWFQQTLKGASDFLGAAFYLGAAHAAQGRDRDAAGAWQMALLSENPAAVYPALVDALLRMGDGRQALDLIEEAPSAWPIDNDRIRREATGLAMLGDYASALPKLVELLDTKNDDQPLLFIAIQVMYKMHLEKGGLDANGKARFSGYVERHQKLGGPDRAIVETWRRFVLK
jgi:VWFA-related protein